MESINQYEHHPKSLWLPTSIMWCEILSLHTTTTVSPMSLSKNRSAQNISSSYAYPTVMGYHASPHFTSMPWGHQNLWPLFLFWTTAPVVTIYSSVSHNFTKTQSNFCDKLLQYILVFLFIWKNIDWRYLVFVINDLCVF